jgi:hypothetical protein
LNSSVDIKTISEEAGQLMMKHGINKSADILLKKFCSLQENGQTALGPALLTSIYLAMAGNPGSTVIICTDGLANKGLGSLDVPN